MIHSAPVFRVGVVVDHDPDPAPWESALVGFLRSLPNIDVGLTTVEGRSIPQQHPLLTGWLYAISQKRFNAFGNLRRHLSESIDSESLRRIQQEGCDLLLWLAKHKPANASPGDLAKYGVITVRFGRNDTVIPFWDEVAEADPISVVTIYWHESSLQRGRPIRSAETGTSLGIFVTENSEEPTVAAIRMLGRLCTEFSNNGTEVCHTFQRIPEKDVTASPAVERPTNFETMRFVADKLLRSCRNRWNARRRQNRWFIAVRKNHGGSITDPDSTDLSGFKEIAIPGVVEAADPFPWEQDGRRYIFFEAMAAYNRKGRVAVTEISAEGSCSTLHVVLERPYSLSYPCIVPYKRDLFLLPESSEIGQVNIYRFSKFPYEVEQIGSLIDDRALVDTTPVFVDPHWYFFTTTVQPFMETLLFWSDRLDGPWNLHPCSPVSTSVTNSRSAGNLFFTRGRLFRPTQDCSVRYGYAIRLNEVTRLTPTEFEERKVNWIPPSWRHHLVATHTWNESESLQAIDGLG